MRRLIVLASLVAAQSLVAQSPQSYEITHTSRRTDELALLIGFRDLERVLERVARLDACSLGIGDLDGDERR